MTEKEKMLKGEVYQPWSEELIDERDDCTTTLIAYNSTSPRDRGYLDEKIKSLIHAAGELMIEQPFYCVYGYNIEVGYNFYAKKNLSIEDTNKVIIGNQVTIGSNVTILTSITPYNEQERSLGYERIMPVFIHDHVYIGGGSVICPNVRINQGAYIIPGSVVTNDIPPYVIAGGNPCKIIRAIEAKDVRRKEI